ncbi:hypothetical protein SAR11G3_00083 [Candidatus Pelagibacter sp. IMCC9063]|nr:hypothetical protein SAR11G3_00083 [Candidatus Pelagibacter sp. IMCC9063]
MIKMSNKSISVDTKEDLEKVKKILRNRLKKNESSYFMWRTWF